MATGGAPGAGPSLGPWAICDRCGLQRRHSAVKREWTQLMVCTDCWDPRPVHMTPPNVDPHEGGPIKDPRPEPEPWFVEDNEITEANL